MLGTLKKIPALVKIYQWMIGYKAHNKHWCRVVMDEETVNLVSTLDYKKFKALEISGSKWSNFAFESYQSANYPEFDICKDTLDKAFDIILAEQVFEHLAWPYRAGGNVYSMLNKGGYFLISTPFLIRIHEYPIDCTRWTPDGLRYFLAECGFPLENIQVFAWGNRKCVKANLDEWMPYNPQKHSLQNEPDVPLVVWALAKK